MDSRVNAMTGEEEGGSDCVRQLQEPKKSF